MWDAVASPGVTTVSFVATPTAQGFVPETYPATPTIYGWIAIISKGVLPCSGCVPIPVPLSIQSVASYSGGVSGTSQPVNATLIIHVEISGLQLLLDWVCDRYRLPPVIGPQTFRLIQGSFLTMRSRVRR